MPDKKDATVDDSPASLTSQTGSGAPSAAPPKPRLGPTVIDVGVKGPRNADVRMSRRPPTAPPRHLDIQPTKIHGRERKRIPVTIADLSSLSPGAAPELRQRALRLIETFVVEDATERSVVLWGHGLQSRYSDLVSQTLALVEADVLKRAADYIGRVTELLGSIDVMAACGVSGSDGVVGNYLKRMSRKIDTPEELDAARVELGQLVKLMGAALDDLLDHKEKLDRHMSQIDDLANEVETASLAAEFLSIYLRGPAPKLSQLFVERGLSLTQTVAQIRSGASMREAQIEQPLRLVGAVRNVALVMLPAWLESIASVMTLAQIRKPTATEAGELAYKIGDILQQLKI